MNRNINDRDNGRVRCNDLIQEIRQLDFSILETALFLDAYPDSQAALDYYHRLNAEREQLVAQYEQSCGPMTIYGNVSRNSWDWTTLPWPWEPEAN